MREHVKGGALTETTFLILLAAHEPRHGYGILQFIERETGGRVAPGAGTLYGAIDTLLKKKWLAPFGGEGEHGKKQYLVTAEGRQKAEEEAVRLREMIALASAVMEKEREK